MKVCARTSARFKTAWHADSLAASLSPGLHAAPLLQCYCTMCNSTRVIPFRLAFKPGISLYEQVVYAATKAIVAGQMRPGDPFPSVRALSKDLKINPNTAHKVIGHLLNDGLLEVRPGIGTVVAMAVPASTAADRGHLLRHDLEQLVVDAKKLGLDLEDVTRALADHWSALDSSRRDSRRKA